MDSLFLLFLVLGTASGAASGEAPHTGARVQAVASARIIQGESIQWDAPVVRSAASGGLHRFENASQRSTRIVRNANGETVRLQEFY